MTDRKININDYSQRKVICVGNGNNNFFSCDRNSPLLDIGKIYNVVSINVYSWHTEIRLKEFPDIPFNSVCFNEIGGADNDR